MWLNLLEKVTKGRGDMGIGDPTDHIFNQNLEFGKYCEDG